MTTTYASAYTSITTEFQTYWNAGAGAIVGGSAPVIRFAGIELPSIPKTYFCRLVMQPVADRQSSFRQTDGKRFRASGIVYIQIFAPKNDPQAYERLRGLSAFAQRRFRSAIDCISFVNVRINDAPPEQSFIRQNVIAEYAYDEIQTG